MWIYRITLILMSFAFASAAFAQSLPRKVDLEAAQMAAACSSSTSRTAQRLVSVYAMQGGGTIYVLEAAKTPCGGASAACGTGGCLVKVIRSSSGSIKTLFDANAFSWQVADSGLQFDAQIHAIYCGGREFANYCEMHLNLRNGKRKIEAVK